MSDVATIIPAREEDPVTALLMRAATDPGFDSQKFETAVAFIREREAKAERRAYNDAMARISEQLDAVPKKGKNNYLNNKYAEKDAMLKVIKPIAAANGVGLRFGSAKPQKPGNQCITLITHLGAHEEITELEGPITVPAASRDGKRQMNDMQAVGSATTYLERYLLGMVFSLVLADEQDDDGEATRNKTEAPPESTPPGDLRETINRDVPLKGKVAAEEAQRQAGYAEILARDDIDIEPLYTLVGYKWIEHLQTMLNNALARDAVEAIGGHTVVSQVMEGMPPAVKEKVTDMLADAMGRFPNEQWTQPPEEDLDELPPIKGEANVMAG